MKHTVQVTVLGQQYALRSEVSAEEVQVVADFVNEKIDEVRASGRAVDTLNSAVLALLNVSGAYLHLKKTGNISEDTQGRLDALLEKIEDAL